VNGFSVRGFILGWSSFWIAWSTVFMVCLFCLLVVVLG